MAASARFPHPVVYGLLILPYGASAGFVTVVLTYLASKAGLGETTVATLTAVWFLPHAWKFLYAPLADTTLDRRRWYGMALCLVTLGTVGSALIPPDAGHFDLLRGLVFLTSTAAAFLGMAVEGLMAESTQGAERARAGAWFQAGSLGGSGIGGGIGLTLATGWAPDSFPASIAPEGTAAGTLAAGSLLAAGFLLCGLALRSLPVSRLQAIVDRPGPAMRHVAAEVWQLARTRAGLLAALLCFLPMSTGAALGVMSQAAVAATWGAGEREVSLVNGLLAGALMACGSLIGGQLGARFGSRPVYAGAALLMACLAAAWGWMPFTPAIFVAMGLAYSFALGVSYASFAGLVLQVIRGRGAATQYNLFASLSNMPVTYMGILLAWVVEHHDARRMLLAEALAGLASLAIVGALVAPTLRKTGRRNGAWGIGPLRPAGTSAAGAHTPHATRPSPADNAP